MHKIIQVTPHDNPGLFEQYISIRAAAMRRIGRENYADAPQPGDQESGFLLAVEEGKVLGGIRMTEVKADHTIPVERLVKGAALASLFPSFDIKAHYTILNFSGSFIANPQEQPNLIRDLLSAALKTAQERKYDMALFTPPDNLAALITRYLCGRGFKVYELGRGTHVNHDGEAIEKPILALVFNKELEEKMNKNMRNNSYAGQTSMVSDQHNMRR